MTSMTVESAKNIGIGVALGLVVLMVLMAWLVKNVTTKLLTVVILGGSLGSGLNDRRCRTAPTKVKAVACPATPAM